MLYIIFRIAYIMIALLYYDNVISSKMIPIPMAFAVVSSEFVDLIISIMLVYLFVTRLRALSQAGIQIIERRISYITRKYVILSTIVIISTQLSLITQTMNSTAWSMAGSTYSKISFMLYCITKSSYCPISSICIFLNLKCNDKWYKIFCCQIQSSSNIPLINDPESTMNNSHFSAIVGK